MSSILDISIAIPDHQVESDELIRFYEQGLASMEFSSIFSKLKFLSRKTKIQKRYSCIPDFNGKEYELFKGGDFVPTIEQRTEVYKREVIPLASKSIDALFENNDITPSDVTHLITVSCTGMSAPGLDLEIMEMMNLPRNTFRTSVNFMGCYAAIHALKLADAICRSDNKANVIIVCTEFCTLHFQKEISIDNITSTLLFADGCAAVLVQQQETAAKGITLNSFFSDVAFKGKSDMSWKLSSTGFLMTLSGYVPDLVKEDFDSLVTKALQHASVNKEEITHWCIHPGGKKILEAIEKSISLPAESLRYSYDTLRDYGNMSSPTILFVLQKIFDELRDNHAPDPNPSKIFAAAFGPGLTMETFTGTYD